MRMVVTGRDGQVATSLREAAATAGITVISCGRPEFDLERPEGIAAALTPLRPDIVVSAAAWTAVDLAESEPDRARLVNERGAGAVASAARNLGVPIIHLSTDYVFDGTLDRPYREDDPTGPTGVYGASKLAGEIAVAATSPDHAILRTAWVHAPEGKNFLRTMLRLAETRDEVGVVADQVGTPTYAPDIADGVIAVAHNVLTRPNDRALRGVFHMTGGGETASWADFAEAIFSGLAERGGKAVTVKRLTTAEFPTPTRRPANSRLDCGRLLATHGVSLPPWRTGVDRSLDRILGPVSRTSTALTGKTIP